MEKKKMKKREAKSIESMNKMEFTVMNEILLIMAKLHSQNPKIYDLVRNFFLFPFSKNTLETPNLEVIKSQGTNTYIK